MTYQTRKYVISKRIREIRKDRKTLIKCKLPYCTKLTRNSKHMGMCQPCYNKIIKLQRGELRIEC